MPTPQECRHVCLDSFWAAIIGLHRVKEGRLAVSPGESRFSTDAVYRAFSRLAKEFPESFPGMHFSEGEVTYSGWLEDFFFLSGSFGLIWLSGDFQSRIVPFSSKESLFQFLGKHVPLEKLEVLAKIGQRFTQLTVKELQSEKASSGR